MVTDQFLQSHRPNKLRTVCLAHIPEHDTAERRVLGLVGLDDVRESADGYISPVGSGRSGGNSQVDLDVLVGRGVFGPVIPISTIRAYPRRLMAIKHTTD